ncbi:MAG: PTS sugar transporter subunit IIA [Verrucomicrobia bacterium]|nr:PTS sugar transporter subunit IIA [Verrucomicrobiota bacterium]
MTVSELINETNLIPDLQSQDRKSAYKIMVQFLVDKGFVKMELVGTILECLQAREDKMTTAMGGGFALPHATIPKLPKLCTLMARSLKGIACDSVDGKLVNIFFLILVPPDQNQAHLQTLATVAKFFNRRGVKSKILHASGAAEILALLRTP